MVHKLLLIPHTDFGSHVYGLTSDAMLKQLDVFQSECLSICLMALRCTRTARHEIVTNVPPLRIRREHLVLSYDIKTTRKQVTATCPAFNWCSMSLEFYKPRRTFAVRLCLLCQELGVDLSDCDKLVTLNVASWETPNIRVRHNLLPRPRSMTPEMEVHHHFRALLTSYHHAAPTSPRCRCKCMVE